MGYEFFGEKIIFPSALVPGINNDQSLRLFPYNSHSFLPASQDDKIPSLDVFLDFAIIIFHTLVISDLDLPVLREIFWVLIFKW